MFVIMVSSDIRLTTESGNAVDRYHYYIGRKKESKNLYSLQKIGQALDHFLF